MLTAEDNDLLTRTGDGTGMGAYFRRFWQPVALSEELPEADGTPVRVTIMGEELVAFRDTEGRVGLIDVRCPHRGADLFFGRNEECGLRCVYHGWKFDVTGKAVDLPNVPPGVRHHETTRTKAYPTREYGEIVWAWLGPADAMPEVPKMEFGLVPPESRYVCKQLIECNWAQVMEGDLDTSHFSFLHMPAPSVPSNENPDAPAVSTVHRILQRHDRIPDRTQPSHRYTRFEKPAPNLLWQMDFKGRVQVAPGLWCHPLTVIDDHSRFLLCLESCGNERTQTVKSLLERTFRRYGLPEAFYLDNGSPWGGQVPGRWTPFGVWLLKLGIEVIHSRPYHPQGRGKNERFHRTLAAEVFDLRPLRDLAQVQQAFDEWQPVYNTVRPHQALDMAVPLKRYRPSIREMPETPPEPEYAPEDLVRRVGTRKAYISFKGRLCRVPKAFAGERVAIRPRGEDGQFGVFFGATRIAEIDLRL